MVPEFTPARMPAELLLQQPTETEAPVMLRFSIRPLLARKRPQPSLDATELIVSPLIVWL